MQSPIARVLQRYFLPSFVTSLILFLKFGCMVSTKSRVQFCNRIHIGRKTVVKPFSIIQVGHGCITIGDNCAIGSYNFISSGDGKISIGNSTQMGPNVSIYGSSQNFRKKDLLIIDQGFSNELTAIGDDVLIGTGVVILKGCDIGEGVIVGANSVVNKDVPPYSIVVGAPAEVIGERI